MSIATDVSRIKGNITAALAAIADKGVTVPDGSTSDALASLIASIEAGGGGVKIGNFTIVNYGSFQLAEDVSSYTIDLGYKGSGGLPAVEQFIILRDMPSTFSGTSTKNSLVIAAELENVSSATSSGGGVNVARYYNSSGSISTSTASICNFNTISSDVTPRTMTVKAKAANANCLLTAGATYNWIVLRRDE